MTLETMGAERVHGAELIAAKVTTLGFVDFPASKSPVRIARGEVPTTLNTGHRVTTTFADSDTIVAYIKTR